MSSTTKFPRLKMTFKIIAVLLLVFIIASVVEHFIKYSTPSLAHAIPETKKLDAYLQKREGVVNGITPNTEKTIEWFGSTGEKTDYVVVYLHGFSATRQETAPLSSLLAQQLKANAFHTRLAGHGLDDELMAEATLKEWKMDTLEAYEIAKRLGDKIILVSVSTGSTLSTWLINQVKDDPTHQIQAQAMVSPNFEARDKNLYIIDWPLGLGVQVAKLVTGKSKHEWEPHNKQQDIYWSNHFHIKGLRPLAQLMKEVKGIDKSQLTIPSVFIYSTKDSVVSTQGIVDTYEQYGSEAKKLITHENAGDPSNHVIAGDILSAESTQPILNMITSFLSANDLISH